MMNESQLFATDSHSQTWIFTKRLANFQVLYTPMVFFAWGFLLVAAVYFYFYTKPLSRFLYVFVFSAWWNLLGLCTDRVWQKHSHLSGADPSSHRGWWARCTCVPSSGRTRSPRCGSGCFPAGGGATPGPRWSVSHRNTVHVRTWTPLRLCSTRLWSLCFVAVYSNERYSLTCRLPEKLKVSFCCQASTSVNRNQTHVTEAVGHRWQAKLMLLLTATQHFVDVDLPPRCQNIKLS